MTDKPAATSEGGPCEVPLIEQLRSVPKDYRTCVAIQWDEAGNETGHRFIPVGFMMHRAADELERSVPSESGVANEGYPGIAHDLETMRKALEDIASGELVINVAIKSAKRALKDAAPQASGATTVRREATPAAAAPGTASAVAEIAAVVISEGMDHRAMIERYSDCPVGTHLYKHAAPSLPSSGRVATDDVAAMDRARRLWHRQCGFDGSRCPTENDCESFNLGFKAALLYKATSSAAPAAALTAEEDALLHYLSAEVPPKYLPLYEAMVANIRRARSASAATVLVRTEEEERRMFEQFWTEHMRDSWPAFCKQPALASWLAHAVSIDRPLILSLAIRLLNSVKAWRDSDGNEGFPQDVREQIDAVLDAYELRRADSSVRPE